MIFVLSNKNEFFLKAADESGAISNIEETRTKFPVQSAKYLDGYIVLIEAPDLITAKLNIDKGKKISFRNGVQWMIL